MPIGLCVARLIEKKEAAGGAAFTGKLVTLFSGQKKSYLAI
jgi:hypothetical protein